jgi:hypothetical protein
MELELSKHDLSLLGNVKQIPAAARRRREAAEEDSNRELRRVVPSRKGHI